MLRAIYRLESSSHSFSKIGDIKQSVPNWHSHLSTEKKILMQVNRFLKRFPTIFITFNLNLQDFIHAYNAAENWKTNLGTNNEIFVSLFERLTKRRHRNPGKQA